MLRFRSLLKWGLALYLAYVLITGILLFARVPEVPETEQYKPEDFRGEGVCADRFTLVETPHDGLAARLLLLSRAQRTLDISYYGIEPGYTADIFLGAVLEAADRGVQVRLLVDGVSGGLTRLHPVQSRALGAHPNITLRQYNTPSLLRPWTLNGRLHDKYIIADDELMMLGGRNIGDRYFSPEKSAGCKLTLDRELLVWNTDAANGTANSVVGQVRAYLDAVWDGSHTQQLYAKDSRRGQARRAEMQQAYREIRQAHPEVFADPEALTRSTVPAARVTFLNNGSAIGPKAPRVRQGIAALLRSAEQSAVLQSPYIVPDKALLTLLDELGQGPADCVVLTNSSATSPNLPAFSSYLTRRSRLLETGLRFFEYQSRGSLHAKTYLVDGRLSAVGSFNLDPRSASLDTELMLVVDSPQLNARLTETLTGYLERSLELQPDGDYLPSDRIQPLEASGFKTALTRVLGVLLYPFRFLL